MFVNLRFSTADLEQGIEGEEKDAGMFSPVMVIQHECSLGSGFKLTLSLSGVSVSS